MNRRRTHRLLRWTAYALLAALAVRHPDAIAPIVGGALTAAVAVLGAILHSTVGMLLLLAATLWALHAHRRGALRRRRT